MIKDGFLRTKESLTIIKGNNGRYALLVSGVDKCQSKYVINDIAAEIISYFGLDIPLSEVLTQMYQKYGTTKDEIWAQFQEFFDELKSYYGVNVELVPEYQKGNKAEIQCVSELYPNGAFIELLDKCNMKCIHCYGGFDTQCTEYMSLEKFKKLADDLVAINVTTLELSGGEITIHPDFIEIVKYALSSNFAKISLITNGSNISDELIDLIAANPERFNIQLDLHGLTDEYLEWFMGAKHYLEHIKKNIRRVASVAKYFRVATIITRLNLHQFEDIADWVYGCGIRLYGVSLVIPIGRAIECGEKDLFLTTEEVYEFKEIFERINDKYPGFISVIDENAERVNCGCLTNNVGIKSNGEMKFCAMDSGNCLSKSIGNVLDGSIQEIYKQNEAFFSALATTEAPRPDGGICQECENLYFCSKCLVRAITMSKKIGDKCKWFAALSPEVKEYVN